MYLIQYNELGVADRIVPDPERGLLGTYVDELPISIDKLIESKSVELSTDNEYYKIIGGNK